MRASSAISARVAGRLLRVAKPSHMGARMTLDLHEVGLIASVSKSSLGVFASVTAMASRQLVNIGAVDKPDRLFAT